MDLGDSQEPPEKKYLAFSKIQDEIYFGWILENDYAAPIRLNNIKFNIEFEKNI